MSKSVKDLFAIGEVLSDSYEVRARLGQGGMGQVFEAHDRVLNRPVAIKASWSHVGGEPLLHEAQAMAALHGCGVPNIYGMGKHSGVDYCVMERVYGSTLEAHLRSRVAGEKPELDEALDILIGVARALADVHSAGLIHCDLKPANIMLAPKDRVVLLDFGLFLIRGKTGNDSSFVCGSPRYMAPELITATVGMAETYLVDIYSLGVISFVVLTGELPLDGITPKEVLWKQVNEVPVPLETILPDAPARLGRLVDEMLAKDPQARPFSADAIASELQIIRKRLG